MLQGGFHSAHTIDGEHEDWSEVMTPITAGDGVEFLTDLVRVSTMVRFGVRICDPDVKDHRV